MPSNQPANGRQQRYVTIKLAESAIGQLLDGLEVLIDQWDYTFRYHEYGECQPDQMIRECSSAAEAQKIRDYYRAIASDLECQLPSREMHL